MIFRRGGWGYDRAPRRSKRRRQSLKVHLFPDNGQNRTFNGHATDD
jgi:hypothetical protein